MREQKPASPDDTIPFRVMHRDPSATQRLKINLPPPLPADEGIMAMLDRVQRETTEFQRTVERALQGAMDNLAVRVMDFRWVEGNRFMFTIDVGGHPKEVLIEKHDGAESGQPAA